MTEKDLRVKVTIYTYNQESSMCGYYESNLSVIACTGQILFRVMGLDFHILNEEGVYKGVGEN